MVTSEEEWGDQSYFARETEKRYCKHSLSTLYVIDADSSDCIELISLFKF